MLIKSVYTTDHDSAAGYGGRIGYRYKTTVTVEFDPKAWNKARRNKAISGFVVDVANALYGQYGFTQTYSPQIDTKARAKNGVTAVVFEYFHNSDPDALKMEYKGYALKYSKPYQGESSQYELDPNGVSPAAKRIVSK